MNDINNIISNLEVLKIQGCLEKQLIPAYLHAVNFQNISFQDLKKVFDACDREILLQQAEQQGHERPIRDISQKLNPFTVFRGCLNTENKKCSFLLST